MDQMDWVHRCMIVTQENVMLARYLAGTFGPSSQGMFNDPLQPLAGSAEPTHYISVGRVDRPFADMLASPAALVAGAAALGVPVEPDVATKLLATSDVSEEEGATALARLGLKRYDWPAADMLTDADGQLMDGSNQQLAEGA